MRRGLLFVGLLLVPLAGLYESLYLGALQQLRWESLLGEAGDFLGDAAPSLREICVTDARLIDSRLCHRLQQVDKLRIGASAALALALLLPLAMLLWALLARAWRPLLLAGRVLGPAWLVWLFLALLADGAVATFGVLLFETALPGQLFPLVTTAIGLAWGTMLLMMAAAAPGIVRARPAFVIATLVEGNTQPRLAALVADLAARLGAWAPEHIVLGLQPALYATGARHYLHPAEQELSLPLLYVSTPLLRALTRDEMVALLAHELAHWSLTEQHYSRRVHPALAALERALHRRPGGFAGVLRWPAVAVLEWHVRLWRHAQERHERLRELLADEAAARLVGPQPLASALVKLAALEGEWRAQDADLERAIAEKRRTRNLARVFQRRLETLEPGGWLQQMASSRVPHPCDRHAALHDRLRDIGMAKGEPGMLSLAPPGEPAIALLDDVERVEESLSDAQHFLYESRVESAAQDA